MNDSTNVVPFVFEGNDVRIVDQNGEAWFILKDVLNAMGSKSRTNDALLSINSGLGDGYDTVVPITDTLGRVQNATIIKENAVTFLVSRSNTVGGKRLNKWIHGEVIPSIRKTGIYQVPLTREQRVAAILRESQGLIEEQNAIIQEQMEQIEDYRPKAEFTESYCDANGLRGFRDMCNLLKANEREFREFLVTRGYMYKKGRDWAVYKKHINNGLFEMVEGHNHKTNINYKTPMFTPIGVFKLTSEWRQFVLFGL